MHCWAAICADVYIARGCRLVGRSWTNITLQRPCAALLPVSSPPVFLPRSCYYTRLKLKSQIIMFNHLLEQQVAMVQASGG